MAQTRKRTSGTRSTTRTGGGKSATQVSWNIPWGKMNLIGIGVGVVVILIGYLLMSGAIVDEPMVDKSEWNNATATVVAPILLTIAYCVIIPMAIFWRKKDGEEETGIVEAEA